MVTFYSPPFHIVATAFHEQPVMNLLLGPIPVSLDPVSYSATAEPLLLGLPAPTYNRPEQAAELTRLCHTFLHVPNIHWLVIEDAANISSKVSRLLGRCGVPFTLLHAKTPATEVQRPEEPRWRHARGVAQRNRGLRWLRENLVRDQDKGVVYMADDDNTYSLQLFNEIRTTKRVSTWPVAFVGGLPWEGCVTKPYEPHVIERMWAVFKPWRVFPVDMAGFAVNLDLILSYPTAEFVYHKKPGLLETEFLKQLGLRNFTEMEPKADGCKRILVWHTQTKPPELHFVQSHLSGKMPELFPDEI
ncbi:Galactosylgalactosylxylosylprotein 3-beta-glucuronosyltransferase 1 [Sparganum proliferum]